MTLSDFPTINAFLNGTAATFLAGGFYFIRKKNIVAHRACMTAAFVASVVFLISYLYYHAHAGATPFTGQGFWRFVYFAILISHTILAAAVPFLAVTTLVLAIRGNIPRHKKFARWTWPIWIFVSITGVIIYVMLYHLF